MLLIKNGTVNTMTDKILDQGEILIDGKKIVKVLNSEEMDAYIANLKEEKRNSITTIDATNCYVMPGIIEPHCHIGITEEKNGLKGDDCNETSNPITPYVKAIDGINPMDAAFHDAVKAGITCVHVGPGSANIVGGQWLVMKTTGRDIDDLIVKEPSAMKIAFGENPKTNYGNKDQPPVTRMAIGAGLREELTKAKTYLEKKKQAKKHYKLYYHTSYYAEEWSSSSCFNTMSYWYIGPVKGEIYPETYENMKGTRLEYSLSEDVMDKEPFGSITLADWQQAYIDNAYFETLYKLGLYIVIEHIMRRGPKSCGMNYRAKTVWGYLNISRQRLKDLTNHPQMNYLDVYRAELKLGEHWDDQIIEALSNGFSVEDIEYIRQFTTLKKFANYFMKFKRSYNLQGLHVTYMDYLRMTESCGYDMTSSINIFPRDLVRAHDSRVDETHKTEAEKRKKEAEQRFKAIRNRFKKADAVYHYEEGTLLIRPAKNASEIVDEGRILHHCVGGDRYLESHAKRKTIICFLRRKKNPDKPYITVEINPDGEIKQWYGIHDSKPSEKRIDKWLDKYTKTLDLKKLRREAHRTIKAS